MSQFIRYVHITTILFGCLCYGIHARSDIQFRISRSEFNKVASVLLKPRVDYRVDVSNTFHDESNGLSYTLANLDDLSNLHVSHVQIPTDGTMLATTFTSVLHHNGNLTLSRSGENHIVYDGPIDVSLFNVTATSVVFMDNSNHIMTPNTIHILPSNCTAKIDDIKVNEKNMQNIGLHITNEDLKDIFQKFICQVYNGKYYLAFEESEVTCTIFDKSITVKTERSYADTKNDFIIVTHELKTSTKDDNMPYPTMDFTPSIPSQDSSSRPFEIMMYPSVLNELFKEFKRELGIGVNDISLGKLLPMLKDVSELDTQGMYMSFLFPTVGKKYPDAVGTLVVSYFDIYFTIKNGSVQIHFDINATLSVRLNCDRNRTFNALKFSMNLFFPTQFGFDNQYITMKILTFGGNFTILESNVGHIMDRGLSSLLYSAPYYVRNHLHKFGNIFRGIPLKNLLPKNVFAEVDLVSIKEDALIIGGSLSLTDPKLPRIKKDQIRWAGINTKKDLFLLGLDNTPENPEDFELEEENCKTKTKVHSSTAIQPFFNVAVIVFMAVIATT